MYKYWVPRLAQIHYWCTRINTSWHEVSILFKTRLESFLQKFLPSLPLEKIAFYILEVLDSQNSFVQKEKVTGIRDWYVLEVSMKNKSIIAENKPRLLTEH